MQTNRVTSPALEKLINNPIPVLDHGFVRVIDYMGDDSAIVQAARVSYGAGTKHTTQDKALIAYLMRCRHTSPFEMCEIKLHLKLPIFVMRQWVRTRCASLNEISARYSVLPNEFYLPIPSEVSYQSTTNKQSRSTSVDEAKAAQVIELLQLDAINSHSHYSTMINDGIARELARIGLSLNHYTELYWKIDLHNLMNFIRLRADDHAQLEIRKYADVLSEIVKEWVPHTHAALVEHVLEAHTFSRTAVMAIQQMIQGVDHTQACQGLPKRELDDLKKILKLEEK